MIKALKYSQCQPLTGTLFEMFVIIYGSFSVMFLFPVVELRECKLIFLALILPVQDLCYTY